MTASATGSAWTVLVTGEETGGRVAAMETRAERGAECPRHVHSREDELLCVLDGRLAIERGRERIGARSGTCLFMPRGTEHGFLVESAEARLLVVVSPAGLERSLVEMEPAATDATDDGLVERLVTAAARYGVAITGPVPRT